MQDRPTNYDDVIDSRDVIEAIEYLSVLRTPGPVDMDAEDADTAQDVLFAELSALEKLAEEASAYAPDWNYGETLIRDSYFQQYAEQLAEDIGAIPDDTQWPCTCIDWEKATRELQMDYTTVDFNGVTYWVR